MQRGCAATDLLLSSKGVRPHARVFSSTTAARRRDRGLKFQPVDAPRRYEPPLKSRERLFIKRRDRVAGHLSARSGGRKLPFIETEWGRKRQRHLRIKQRAVEHVEQLEADREQRQSKTEMSGTLTAHLPELTAGDVEQVYLSLMAPSSSQAALTAAARALPAPEQLGLAHGSLAALHQRLLPGSASVPALKTEAVAEEQIEQCVAAMEEELAAIEASRQALALSEKSLGKQPEAGLATHDEWHALLSNATRLSSPEMVFRILHLVQRSGVDLGPELLKSTAEEYALRRNVPGAETLLALVIEAGMPVDASVHEAVLRAHIAAGDLINAQFYLRALEQRGIVPTAESYFITIDALLTARKPTQAFDLFAHSRLVAHPVPTAKLYNRMIHACAETSSHKGVSPERALDLRQEMQDNGVDVTGETYGGLILACMRSARPEYYIKALNLLREMLNAGYRAERGVLEAVLEGAARQGDLARARWVFLQMLSAAETGEVANAPRSTSLVSLLQAHAKHVIEPVSLVKTESTEAKASDSADAEAENLEAMAEKGEEAAEGDEPMQFPGAMPRTAKEVLRSAQLLVERYARAMRVPDFISRPRAAEAEAFIAQHREDAVAEVAGEASDDVGFSQMTRSDRVLDAYLYATREHGSIAATYALFQTMYRQFGRQPSESAVAIMMQAFLNKRKHPAALEMASEVFAEYAKTLGPNALTVKPGDGRTALAPYTSFTSRIWSCIIQLMACKRQVQPSVQLATQFAVLYPPSLTTHHARTVKEDEKRVPEAEVRLASPDYPETSSFHANARPPTITREQVGILYRLLVEQQANEAVRWVKDILDQYTLATAFAERILRGNDAMPNADRGPAALIGKAPPKPGQVSLLSGNDAATEAQRRAMFGNHGVHWDEVDHPPPAPLGPLDRRPAIGKRQEVAKVSPPPGLAGARLPLAPRRSSARVLPP